MSYACFGPRHSAYSNFYCCAHDIAAVGTIFNVLSFMRCITSPTTSGCARCLAMVANPVGTLKESTVHALKVKRSICVVFCLFFFLVKEFTEAVAFLKSRQSSMIYFRFLSNHKIFSDHSVDLYLMVSFYYNFNFYFDHGQVHNF